MLNFLKRLFCFHNWDYETRRKSYYEDYPYELLTRTCRKCGKVQNEYENPMRVVGFFVKDDYTYWKTEKPNDQ